MTLQPETHDAESRVTTTAIIWGFATGMLALAIPLSLVTQQSLIILGVILLGATLTTATVWLRTGDRAQNQRLTQQIQTLEARIADLEEICSH